ncbi:hypothetical protein BMA721280_A0078 [Burkholderia mallei 2002721280]|nr:hypothetical protein BMA721280_A0078 [Burkholderia mallei 2002721280]EDP88782.1 hypothetical protein BMA10399_E0321 [Burkholderia mallei ATCC 10399]
MRAIDGMGMGMGVSDAMRCGAASSATRPRRPRRSGKPWRSRRRAPTRRLPRARLSPRRCLAAASTTWR